MIKGAMDYLATMLGVSKYTLYNYLQKIRAQHEYALKGGKYSNGTSGFNS
jgi:predicted transcriptional regulator